MPTPKPMTQGERLARIETILEAAFMEGGTISGMRDDFKGMRGDLKEIKSDLDADVADLARLKHRGAGILVGVSIAFTAIGALLRPTMESVIAIFR